MCWMLFLLGDARQDGVDIDSCDDVLIADSTIACGDDNVVLKSGLGAAGTSFNVPTRNVIVRNVSCLSGEGIAIGSEIAGGIFNATFQNLTIANMNRAMSIKGCADMPLARVENVTFRDIVFYNVVEFGIFINLDYKKSKNVTSPHPRLSGVSFININGSALAAGELPCFANAPCEYMLFQNVIVKALIPWSACAYLNGIADHVVPDMSGCLIPQ
jgi:polygalacturonase